MDNTGLQYVIRILVEGFALRDLLNILAWNCTVIAASDLRWMISAGIVFRPYVEVSLLGPAISNMQKRKQATKSKNNTLMPKFNELFLLYD